MKDLAGASVAIKELGDHVRQETINAVRDVEPIMKGFYEKLYDNEHLTLDLVTPGHAANPTVKDEFNIYLRAGESRLPASPFTNAGRLRALALCFAFSLHTRAHGTLAIHLLDDPAMSLDDEHKARFVDHVVGPCFATGQVLLATHYEKFFKCAELRFGDGVCLQLVPRRTHEDAIAFEPANLLQRVGDALAAKSTAWREHGINIRRWGERTLATLSGYCPLPFVIFNNIPDTVKAYEQIKDERIATPRRDAIVKALQSPQFVAVMHKVAHDEVVTESEIRDAHKVLSDCRKTSEAEIARLQEIHKHELLKRAISARPALSVLRTDILSPSKDITVIGHAAAASGGVGITWIDPEKIALSEHPTLIIKSDILAPIATIGNYALLDTEETPPLPGDLVAVLTDTGKFLRRFWRHESLVNLEAVNPITPHAPVVVHADQCEVRRIIGVLFEGLSIKSRSNGEEWAIPGSVKASQFDGLQAIRVDGTSLEPIARDGQVVLVRKVTDLRKIGQGDLACVDVEEVGAVLKRCYLMGKQMVVCPVNPVNVEEPIVVMTSAINHAYLIVGVLFESISSSMD